MKIKKKRKPRIDKINLANFPKRKAGPVNTGKFIKALKGCKNTQQRYNLSCDLAAKPDAIAWWVNAWLRGNPPLPVERGRM